MMKVGIIIGHDEKSQGAVTYNKITEYEFNKFIAETIQSLHTFKVSHGIHKFLALHIFNRNNGWQSVVNQIKANDINITIELHLNSFSKVATGTESLYLENDLPSKDLAQHLSFRIAKHYNSKLRGESGTVGISAGERGHQNLNFAKNGGAKFSVLVEPAFVNFSTTESIAFVNNPLEYANILYRAIEDFYNQGDNLNGISKAIN